MDIIPLPVAGQKMINPDNGSPRVRSSGKARCTEQWNFPRKFFFPRSVLLFPSVPNGKFVTYGAEDSLNYRANISRRFCLGDRFLCSRGALAIFTEGISRFILAKCQDGRIAGWMCLRDYRPQSGPWIKLDGTSEPTRLLMFTTSRLFVLD